jgi:hypothetical protein
VPVYCRPTQQDTRHCLKKPVIQQQVGYAEGEELSGRSCLRE